MIDIIGITGAAAVTAGFAWIYPPLGLIVGGGLLLSAAVIASLRVKPKAGK